MTIKNRYPLPRTKNLFDLRSNYHQLRIKECDISKTMFRTRYEHFEFTLISFGLANAPTIFIIIKNRFFRSFFDMFVVVLTNDILVYSKNVEDHKSHLRLVLGKLKENQLFPKLSK